MQDLINFYKSINTLKHTQRQGWKNRLNLTILDTIASHSFGATLLGWYLAKVEDVKEDKVLKLLTMHDLMMAHMRDLTPNDKDYLIKKEIERKAFKQISLPDNLKEEFTELFNEYQEQISIESRIAKEADKLDTILQAREYLNKEEYIKFIDIYKKYFKSETGKQIIKELQDEILC